MAEGITDPRESAAATGSAVLEYGAPSQWSRRTLKRWVTILALVVAALLGWKLIDRVKAASRVNESRHRGAVAAQADLKAGRAVTCSAGMPIFSEDFDLQRGLPLRHVAGCVVTDEITAYIDSYNATIRDHFVKNGPPPYSRAPWRAQLQNLSVFYRAAKTGSEPILGAGAPAVTSPDGAFSLSVQGPRSLSATNASGIASTAAHYHDLNGSRVLFGPPGSDFAVLAHEPVAGTSGWLAAIDLRNASLMREERWSGD